MLSLITLHKSRVPWVESLDGNTSDKTRVGNTINAFLDQIGKTEARMLFVADSALYTKAGFRGLSERIDWVTRVPETVGLVRPLQDEMPLEGFAADDETLPGIQYCEVCTTVGAVPQRWVVVFSESAWEREKKTLERAVAKEGKSLEASIKTLSQNTFSCRGDAERGWRETFQKVRTIVLSPESSRKIPDTPRPGGRRRDRFPGSWATGSRERSRKTRPRSREPCPGRASLSWPRTFWTGISFRHGTWWSPTSPRGRCSKRDSDYSNYVQ